MKVVPLNLSLTLRRGDSSRVSDRTPSLQLGSRVSNGFRRSQEERSNGQVFLGLAIPSLKKKKTTPNCLISAQEFLTRKPHFPCVDMSVMEGDISLVAGRSQREKRRSYKDLLREEEEIAAQVRKSSKKVT